MARGRTRATAQALMDGCAKSRIRRKTLQIIRGSPAVAVAKD